MKRTNDTMWTHKMVLALSLGLFAVLALLLPADDMLGLEQNIFETIYNWPIGLLGIMTLLTEFGGVWMALSATAILLISKLYKLVAKLVVTIVLGHLSVVLFKSLIQRFRPEEILSWVIDRQPGNLDFGFPSGHVMAATVFAILICRGVAGRLQYFVMALWIITVGLSRVYLGAHSPLDVVGGFLIGLSAVLIVDLLQGLPAKRKKHKL